MFEFTDVFSAALGNMRDMAIHLTASGGHANLTSASRLYAVFAGCTAFAAVGLPTLLLHFLRTRKERRARPHMRRMA